MPLYKRKNIDWYRHLAFACVGGFFGAYAIMSRGGVMGSAQTVNLLELVIDALYGRGFNVLEHLGAFLLYAAATMLTVLLPFWWSVNVRRLSPIITAAVMPNSAGNIPSVASSAMMDAPARAVAPNIFQNRCLRARFFSAFACT